MKIKTSTKEKGTDFKRPHIEEGIYNAIFKEIKDISEGQFGQRVAFIYEIQDEDLALVCYKPEYATKENRFGKALIAHGVVIDDNETDTDNLPNKKVKAWVEDFEYEVDEGDKKVKKLASSISKVKAIPKED